MEKDGRGEIGGEETIWKPLEAIKQEVRVVSAEGVAVGTREVGGVKRD